MCLLPIWNHSISFHLPPFQVRLLAAHQNGYVYIFTLPPPFQPFFVANKAQAAAAAAGGGGGGGKPGGKNAVNTSSSAATASTSAAGAAAEGGEEEGRQGRGGREGSTSRSSLRASAGMWGFGAQTADVNSYPSAFRARAGGQGFRVWAQASQAGPSHGSSMGQGGRSNQQQQKGASLGSFSGSGNNGDLIMGLPPPVYMPNHVKLSLDDLTTVDFP